MRPWGTRGGAFANPRWFDVQAGFIRLRGHSKTDLLSLLKDSAKNDAMINSKDFARIMQGPSERDLVYSGLEETMSNAVREMVCDLRGHTGAGRGAGLRTTGGDGRGAQLTISEELNCSLRSAAYVCSIRKIYAVYKDAGLILA